ncbi:hypothetical protein TNCT_35571 [Trichonephila clavata]|uniref:Uncharacterized protein n=1 Tax=Trichonephila clavata TaxID=2740835 RepID=A0A8X6L175_TRICU|nr:hypothetical protein TNCT_35571 [Trichonephila clavata]
MLVKKRKGKGYANRLENCFERAHFDIVQLYSINRTYFCMEYPDLCETPENLESYCQQKPFVCEGNTSDLLFAKLDFSSDSSEKNFSDAVRNIQLAHNMSLNAESMFGWNVQSDKR